MYLLYLLFTGRLAENEHVENEAGDGAYCWHSVISASCFVPAWRHWSSVPAAWLAHPAPWRSTHQLIAVTSFGVPATDPDPGRPSTILHLSTFHTHTTTIIAVGDEGGDGARTPPPKKKNKLWCESTTNPVPVLRIPWSLHTFPENFMQIGAAVFS